MAWKCLDFDGNLSGFRRLKREVIDLKKNMLVMLWITVQRVNLLLYNLGLTIIRSLKWGIEEEGV